MKSKSTFNEIPVSTEDFRTNLSDNMNEVKSGNRIIVNKYRKPVAVMIPYKDYKKMMRNGKLQKN
jgi:prevent-host-death family protein